ncbi:Zinc transporter ZitB [Sodalis praecaptivus]
MMSIAVAGLVANLVSFWLLHGGSGEKNINLRAAALHVLGICSVRSAPLSPHW